MKPIEQHPLTLCIVGGGARYTPDLISALAERTEHLSVGRIRLLDIDEHRLEIVGGYASKLAELLGLPAVIDMYTSQEAAVEGSDLIVVQSRVGGLQARSQDISLCLRHGLVGEETTGVGGFCLAMRTIPMLVSLSHDIKRLAPEAWVLNLSNPTGIGTEVLSGLLGSRVLGVCTTPWRMRVDIAQRLSLKEEDVLLDYVGLNHLGWLRGVVSKGEGRIETERWLKHFRGLSAIKEAPWLEFPEELILALQMIPSLYLQYFYNRTAVLETLMSMPLNRAELLMRDEAALLSSYQMEDVVRYRPSSRRRSLYDLAVAVIDSIVNDRLAHFVLNVKNGSAIHGLPQDCVVEMPCSTNGEGVSRDTFLAPGEPLSPHVLALLQTVKSCELLTIAAGIAGDRKAATLALITHPLGPSPEIVSSVLDDILTTHSAFLPQFG